MKITVPVVWEAFYELMSPYERMIYATAIAVLKNPADAEEVA